MAVKYGNAGISDRLKRARVVAGYRSARSAAAAFGWPSGSYLGFESGTRRVPDDRLAEFAMAFQCPLEWLKEGDAPRTGRGAMFATVAGRSMRELIAEYAIEEERNLPATVPAFDSGHRLALARALAGFKNAHAAAHAFGFRPSTYGAYEAGRTKLPALMAGVYGMAFGVNPNWLRTGEPPSGLDLPHGVTDEEAATLVATGDMTFPATSVIGDATVVSALDAMEGRRISSRSVDPADSLKIPEWRRACHLDTPVLAEWTLPAALVNHVPKSRRGALVIITVRAIEGVATRIQAGDRVAVVLGGDGDPAATRVALDETSDFVITRDPGNRFVGTVALHLGGSF